MAGVRFTWPGRQGFTLEGERFEVGRGESLLLTNSVEISLLRRGNFSDSL